MRCPACDAELTAVTFEDVTVDACQGGCGGIWFDRGEMTFDPPAELLRQFLDALAAGHTTRADVSQRRRCPRCPDSVLMRHFSSTTRAVTIDECPTCAGIWLDNGELEQIRLEHASAEDRRRAVVQVFEERLIDDRMMLIAEQLNLRAPFATWRSRVASGAIVALYLGVATVALLNRDSSGLDLVRVLGFCVLPLACIWFPDELARFGGRITFQNLKYGRKPLPPSFVWFLGWVALLVPVVIAVILWFQGIGRP